MADQTVFLSDWDNPSLMRLCGALEENIKQLEKLLEVSVERHDRQFLITGILAKEAANALTQLAEYAKSRDISGDDLILATASARTHHKATKTAAFKVRRGMLTGRTAHQEQYIRALQKHDIVFGLGPAGTGKTYLAVAAAVDAMQRHAVERIILVRPAVEAGEKLGFLPGDLAQKVDPYLRPLYDALFDLAGFDTVNRLLEKGLIEIAPLAYMRGRTLSNAYVILDEAQNTTVEQMKMFLTRIGFGAKAVITGDLSQIDLPHHIKSGLKDAWEKLSHVEGIAFHSFTSVDIVRHPLVQKIVDAYEANHH